MIDASRTLPDGAVAIAQAFMLGNHVRVLNVAGPRASEAADAYDYAKTLITTLLRARSDDAADHGNVDGS